MRRFDRIRIAAIVAAGVAVAVAIAFAFGRRDGDVGARGDATATATVDRPVARAEIDALRAELEEESFERERLAAEIELMRTVIEQLAIGASSGDPGGPAAGAPPPDADGAAEDPAEALGFEAEVLDRIGMTERELLALRERWDEAQLARLELNDRAARNGWLFKPRHRRALQVLDERLRNELGEDDYERMLYATEQSNRIVVQSVIGGSAADNAGIQPGDQVLAYAGLRTFAPRDVAKETRSGRKGELVRVRILRGDDVLSVTVPRGPLGVRMAGTAAPPAR